MRLLAPYDPCQLFSFFRHFSNNPDDGGVIDGMITGYRVFSHLGKLGLLSCFFGGVWGTNETKKVYIDRL